MPNDAELLADRILTVLVEGVVNEPDLEKRFKLEAGLKGVGGMTRDVLVDVVATAIARSTAATSTAATSTAVTQPWSYPYERVAQDHP
jgi:3-deoxy-D-arabino-heptulosonate 7-phosphate (DAHP) synthase